MAVPPLPQHFISGAWKTLSLFLIPIGGGIPAGVIVAKNYHLPWPVTTFLYFISDVILACIFEPLMLMFIEAGKRSGAVMRFINLLKESTRRSTAQFGTRLGPLTLIAIAFGVDPMTGRSVAKAAGHGFVTGWALAITGDMGYFLVIMASTLWLNSILGNGTLTTIIIFALMLVVPGWIRRFRERRRNPTAQTAAPHFASTEDPEEFS